ncbi:hypothetical protein E2F43_09590 [Seongchinamella unica]|uniref:Uncharacterized protein n=1 Tax=Seongchinamella unica TaxID=2547392 RepID=A0A4R5LS81_9GAMM|nr:hypothetical protein [Seongchinamella unica]TDG13759.1 hypothetical protein E2F43_09590 [Seongchinamella unica]
MSSARGQANHALYLAKILLAAWRRELAAESISAVTLAQAYLPGVRGHLGHAYGWFLLEIIRPGALPEQPPASLAELPEIAEGKAVPGEIVEFQRLEAEGWIGDMLAGESVAGPTASAGNLATTAPAAGPEQAEQWVLQLQSLFDRMGDSLDEY